MKLNHPTERAGKVWKELPFGDPLTGASGIWVDATPTSEVESLQRPAAPAQAVVTDERAEFEKWALGEGFNTQRDDSDKYRDYHRTTTRWAWQAWNARALLAVPAEGERHG